MEVLLFIVGQVACLFGILLLFYPKLLIKLSEFSNQTLRSGNRSRINRYLIGCILTLGGVFLLYESIVL